MFYKHYAPHYVQCAMPTPLDLLEVDGLDEMEIPGEHVYESMSRLIRLKPLIEPDSLVSLYEQNILYFHRWKGMDCFVLTDTSEWACAVRRLDGQPFRRGRKDMSAGPNWAIGLTEGLKGGYSKFILCEGVTDYLAAYDAMLASFSDWWPLCMRGASSTAKAEWFPDGRNYRFLSCGDKDRAGKDFNRAHYRDLHRLGDVQFFDHCDHAPNKTDLYDALGDLAGRWKFMDTIWVLDDSKPDEEERKALDKLYASRAEQMRSHEEMTKKGYVIESLDHSGNGNHVYAKKEVAA